MPGSTADCAAPGRDIELLAPDPHGQDRLAAVPAAGPCSAMRSDWARRPRPAHPVEADDPGLVARSPCWCALADRAVARRDAAQSLDRAINHDDPAPERGSGAWNEFDRVIASIPIPQSRAAPSSILTRRWDIVIVDEPIISAIAHLAWSSPVKFRSSTPPADGNPRAEQPRELFNLVTALEPGLLITARQFQRPFMDRRDS